uniref:Variant surface glycoprotein n=1 Tax=Trypanosoma brucei TaxID=5691 RepID=A0A1V0FXT0_9TRYP|nr:variant surface glycoprotein [Trypanosoma brucei]
MYFLTPTLVIFLQTLAHGAFDANARQDLMLLCDIANLRGREISKPEVEDDFSQTITELEKMNMSTAEQAWQDLFTGDPNTDSYDKKHKDATQEPFKTHWKQTYDKWLGIKHGSTTGVGAEKWINKNPPPRGGASKQLAHAIINHSLEELTKLKQQFTEAKEEATSGLPGKASTKIREAIFGASATSDSCTAAITVTQNNNWANSCDANGATSVLGDMLCICGTASAGSADECKTANIALTWNTGVCASAALILSECPTQPTAAVTATELKSLIDRFRSGLRSVASAGALKLYLGKTNAGTCSGNTGEACVDYSKYFATGAQNTGVSTVPWVAKLVGAISDIEAGQQKAKLAHKLSAKINNIISAAERAYKTTVIPETSLATANPSTSQKTDSQKVTEAEDSCNKHKDRTTCQPPCKWNANATDANKKCTLDPKKAAEQQATQAAGTGDGATATTTGCARHQNQPDCEKDKTGDKQNCAWRKGKDGETDEPEKEKCRNGSFLLNNKFALSVVSAAFMALLF